MKRIINVIALIVLISSQVFAQKNKNNIEASVVGFFNGLSLINADTLKHYSTSSDFLLLEDGHVWNLDTLIQKTTSSKNLNIIRTNKFNFIRTEQYKNMAWVSYYNTADFRLNEKQQTIKWLESAVLLKENGRWKIKLLHSTRMK